MHLTPFRKKAVSQGSNGSTFCSHHLLNIDRWYIFEPEIHVHHTKNVPIVKVAYTMMKKIVHYQLIDYRCKTFSIQFIVAPIFFISIFSIDQLLPSFFSLSFLLCTTTLNITSSMREREKIKWAVKKEIRNQMTWKRQAPKSKTREKAHMSTDIFDGWCEYKPFRGLRKLFEIKEYWRGFVCWINVHCFLNPAIKPKGEKKLPVTRKWSDFDGDNEKNRYLLAEKKTRNEYTQWIRARIENYFNGNRLFAMNPLRACVSVSWNFIPIIFPEYIQIWFAHLWFNWCQYIQIAHKLVLSNAICGSFFVIRRVCLCV